MTLDDFTVILILVFSILVVVFVAGFFFAPELLGISKRESEPKNDEAGDKLSRRLDR